MFIFNWYQFKTLHKWVQLSANGFLAFIFRNSALKYILWDTEKIPNSFKF